MAWNTLLGSVFFFLLLRRPPRSTLSLHDALPIYLVRKVASSSATHAGALVARVTTSTKRGSSARSARPMQSHSSRQKRSAWRHTRYSQRPSAVRSEEHTSELQSRRDLVCRLLLEK